MSLRFRITGTDWNGAFPGRINERRLLDQLLSSGVACDSAARATVKRGALVLCGESTNMAGGVR